uniref:golgin candidate 2 n=1 Tax=Erigeron canadensis TaxID=72917 RepID=UPI001CB971C9|nr:golgin candidate 2 [Erigeron canadensis]
MSGWISSKLRVAETLLQQIDQQAAESLRKNEGSSRSDDNIDNLTHPPPKTTKPHSDILKQKLNKKIRTPPPPSENTQFVDATPNKNSNNVEVFVSNDVKPKTTTSTSVSLTDSDWTQLLSAPPATTTTSKNFKVKPKELSSGKRQVPSSSNLVALDKKPNQDAPAKTLADMRSSDLVVGDSTEMTEKGNKNDDVETEMLVVEEKKQDAVIEKRPEIEPAISPSDMDVKERGKKEEISGVPISSSSKKAEDMETESDSDSETTSDSETDEIEREERMKKREQLLAQKAAAKAIEAIKDRENLVARLEGEKQSLEKIIDERAKQQAHEASELQMTMMETMDAVDLEKQKHNNTRMEALIKLAKLETTNAELAKSLATAQWNLEVEVKRVAELHRQIELKEASHKELASKKGSHPSGNKLTTSRGVELGYEMLEAEHTFIIDKVGQLQEKAKNLEANIQVTRKEIENPTEVEVELKRRLGQLTDHLIQKQAQVEALSSEKAMLMFRIEAVSRSLDETKSSMKTSTINDLESGGLWDSNSKFQDRIQQGQKHIGSLVRQLDSIFSTGAAFLRRNPMAKIWSFVYLVCLHFWVFYIFRSHTAVSDEAGSGAAISLENINNVGV